MRSVPTQKYRAYRPACISHDANFACADDRHGSVEAHNVDDMWEHARAKCFELIRRVGGLPPDTTQYRSVSADFFVAGPKIWVRF